MSTPERKQRARIVPWVALAAGAILLCGVGAALLTRAGEATEVLRQASPDQQIELLATYRVNPFTLSFGDPPVTLTITASRKSDGALLATRDLVLAERSDVGTLNVEWMPGGDAVVVWGFEGRRRVPDRVVLDLAPEVAR